MHSYYGHTWRTKSTAIRLVKSQRLPLFSLPVQWFRTEGTRRTSCIKVVDSSLRCSTLDAPNSQWIYMWHSKVSSSIVSQLCVI